MCGCQTERNWMESEFSCEKDMPNAALSRDGQTTYTVKDSWVSGLLQDTFWSTDLLVQANSNHYFKLPVRVWVIVIHVYSRLKNSIIKSHICDEPRPFQFTAMLQISCRQGQAMNQPSYLYGIPTKICKKIQMAQSPTQKIPSKHITFMSWIHILHTWVGPVSEPLTGPDWHTNFYY